MGRAGAARPSRYPEAHQPVTLAMPLVLTVGSSSFRLMSAST